MKTVQNITLFLSVLLLIGLVYISFFNVYQTDDYIFSYSTTKLGLIGNIEDFYMNWGGRYFGYTINMFTPLSRDTGNILPKVYPIFLLLSFITVITLNFRLYFNYSFTKSFTKSLLLFFFYTVVLCSIPEHYYWITGSNIYFIPNILSGILLISYKKYKDDKSKIWLYLSTIIVFILMGANELIALLLLGILVFINLEKPSHENKILLIIGIIGILISFLAPGNFNRMIKSNDEFYWKWTKRIAFFSFNSVYIFIKIIFLVPLFITVFFKELNFIKNKLKYSKAFVIWIISFLPLLFFGYLINIVGRSTESIIFFFLTTFSLVLAYKNEKIRKFWWLSLFIIFLPETDFFRKDYSSYNIDYNLNNFIKEIFVTDLKKYDHEIAKRISIIQNSKKDSLKIEKIREIPKILYFDELSSVNEKEKYVNDQLEKYFHKKNIVVQ